MSLAEDADKHEIDAWLHVQCLVVEDEGISKEDPVAVSVASADVECAAEKDDSGKGRFKLVKTESPTFTFKTKKYPTDWTTCLRVTVEEV